MNWSDESIATDTPEVNAVDHPMFPTETRACESTPIPVFEEVPARVKC
jgi:hypothetical protein